MIANISIFCLSSLLLFNLAEGKPMSNLQNLKQLLDDAQFVESQESTMEQKEAQEEKTHQWESAPRNSALAGKDTAFDRLLGDILSTSKRSWSRFKKGGLRSCFGVRLERIGSFSGLGC